jgi:hypothetical protein
MTPCENCNAYMRRFPGATHSPLGSAVSGSIGAWHLWYHGELRGLRDAGGGDAKTKELIGHGWSVTKG